MELYFIRALKCVSVENKCIELNETKGVLIKT